MNLEIQNFNVIVSDFNTKEFKSYNVIPYFIQCYKKAKQKPKTFEEFKEFIKKEGMYMYWARCQYEIVLVHWPYKEDNPLDNCKKIDVWWQIENNIDLVTRVLMYNINK